MSQFTPNLSGRVGDGGDRTAVHHEQPRGSIVFQDRRGRRARDLNSIRGKGGRVDVNLQGPLHDQIGLLAALRPHERVLCSRSGVSSGSSPHGARSRRLSSDL
jgi:hypothetical protein